MAQKIKTVKIKLDDKVTKEFVIKEFTIQNILDLSQQNSLFQSEASSAIKKSQNGGEQVESVAEKGFIEEMMEHRTEIEGIMKKTCNFSLEDLKPLAPSDIKKLYSGFQEVNEDFLDVLEKLKILEMLRVILEKHIKNFLKVLVVL